MESGLSCRHMKQLLRCSGVKMSMPGFMKDETETETSETPTVSTFDWDAEYSAYDYDAAVQSAVAACAAASKHEADFDDALAALMGR